MKKIYGIIIGIVLIVLATVLFSILGNGAQKETVQTLEEVSLPRVEVIQVKPSTRPFIINATGTLRAQEKIEIFSEVQGVLLPNTPAFKEGNSFRKGFSVIRIDDAEYLAQLKSSKSSLMSEIAAMLADMEVEFPEEASDWEKYLRDFEVDEKLTPLPIIKSDEVKFFVTGRNIIQSYYNVKNQEERLSKYIIYAPFNGLLTEANVNPGALVRSGQKLGELIDPSVFELTLMVPASQNEYLRLGASVVLSAVGGSKMYRGRIIRINPKINQQTQTIEVYAEVAHPDLKEGQYLNARIDGGQINEVVPITSNLLTANESVYVVKEEALQLKKVQPVNYVGDSLVVKGLNKGDMILTQPIANAYPGMRVSISKTPTDI